MNNEVSISVVYEGIQSIFNAKVARHAREKMKAVGDNSTFCQPSHYTSNLYC